VSGHARKDKGSGGAIVRLAAGPYKTADRTDAALPARFETEHDG